MSDNLILKLFLSYIKENIKIILIFVIFSVIFVLVFWLYSIPLDAILYAFLLSASIGTIAFAYRFYRYYNRHKILKYLDRQITFSVENLPKPCNLIEFDYQKLLHILYDDKMNLESDFKATQSEMIDYYTLWVHQIKTPISAMRLLLQSEKSHYKTEMLLELFKIEQYVEIVLQYLRLYNISSDLVFVKCNLDDIVKQAIKKYSVMFIQKKLTLNLEQLDTYVLTDEKWTIFVIEQILSNALKYTLNGSISIYMDKKSPNTLVIEDTGIGIAKQDLPRIFEKGFTGYNGRIDKKSTGIGLYLCKKIISKLSHSIEIVSEVSVGTKAMIDFSVTNAFIE